MIDEKNTENWWFNKKSGGGIFYGSEGTKILCDPWIVTGVFEGSWFHYPPLKMKIN